MCANLRLERQECYSAVLEKKKGRDLYKKMAKTNQSLSSADIGHVH